MEEETDSVFALRLELLRRGHNAIGNIWWEQLAKKHPKRCMRLFALRLRLLIRSGLALRSGRHGELTSTGIESNERDEAKSLRRAAARCPHLVWGKIAPLRLPLAKLHRWAERNHDWTDFNGPATELFNQTRDELKLCEQVLVAAGRAMARRQPQAFKLLVAKWSSRACSKCLERCLLRSMETLPDSEGRAIACGGAHAGFGAC